MRRRKIVRRDYGKVVVFEEVIYGMLMMVFCDREGRIYDVWISFGSVHDCMDGSISSLAKVRTFVLVM